MSDSVISRLNAIPGLLRKHNLFVLCVVLAGISQWLSPVFLTPMNVLNLLRQASFTGLVSLGMTLVIISGGIDLSVGATYGLGGMVLAFLFHFGLYSGYVQTLQPMFPTPLIVLAALAAGGLVGLVNGLLVGKARIPAFVTTLGTMVAVRGLAYSMAGGRTIFGLGESVQWLGMGAVGRIPSAVILWAAAALLVWAPLRFSVFGKRLYAVGGDEEAARLSGIKVDKYRIMVYVVSGVLAALAGIIIACRTDQGEPRQGEGMELDAIAASIIGGASDGRGSVSGTILGVLLLAMITNILNLIGVHPFPQQIVKGLIIVGGLLLQRALRSSEGAREKAPAAQVSEG